MQWRVFKTIFLTKLLIEIENIPANINVQEIQIKLFIIKPDDTYRDELL